MNTPKQRRSRSTPRWMRHAGIGVEFAAAMVGFALVGYWIDNKYGTAPWGVIVGAALGLIGGTYNLVRESMAAFRENEPSTDQDGKKPDGKKQNDGPSSNDD